MLAIDKIYNLDALEGLKQMEDHSVQCCVTSPPYWGLRDYGIAGQLGMEKTPERFVEKLVYVFREVNRVLSKDGTLWLNIGDSYASAPKKRTKEQAARKSTLNGSLTSQEQILQQQNKVVGGLKPKDLVGVPWRLAFALQGFAVVPFYKFSEWADILGQAREKNDWSLVEFVEGVLRQMDLLSSLQADGWYLRQDIIWQKPNPMPEPVVDRCTKSHEYIFLLSKSGKYFYDNTSIATDTSRKPERSYHDFSNPKYDAVVDGRWKHQFDERVWGKEGTANRRSVWSVATNSFNDAHFATFPEEIPATCIKAGSKEGDIILDPFMGAGTTALVAKKLNRHFVGFELNPEYIQIADKRMERELGMFHKSVIDQ